MLPYRSLSALQRAGAGVAGRLLRRRDGKCDALVIDIVDDDFPIFRNMWKKRRTGYEKMDFNFEFVAEPKLIAIKDESRAKIKKKKTPEKPAKVLPALSLGRPTGRQALKASAARRRVDRH